jgi:hypothetical protein
MTPQKETWDSFSTFSSNIFQLPSWVKSRTAGKGHFFFVYKVYKICWQGKGFPVYRAFLCTLSVVHFLLPELQLTSPVKTVNFVMQYIETRLHSSTVGIVNTSKRSYSSVVHSTIYATQSRMKGSHLFVLCVSWGWARQFWRQPNSLVFYPMGGRVLYCG